MSLVSTSLDVPSMGDYAYDWALVDVETSGLIARRDRVLSVAVITIGPDSAAREGARLMLDHQIGALPVLDDGHLVGIITETDIVRAFVRTTAPVGGFRH